MLLCGSGPCERAWARACHTARKRRERAYAARLRAWKVHWARVRAARVKAVLDADREIAERQARAWGLLEGGVTGPEQ